MFYTENKIKTAVHKVGGPTIVSNLMCVANGTVHAWIRAGRINNIDKAKKLAELAKMSVEELRPV